MHEMSLVTSILDIAQAEAVKHGASRLTLVRVRYGSLANVVPEAMRMAFTGLTLNTPHADCRLELVEEKARLRCMFCAHVFEARSRDDMFEACPACSDYTSYIVEAGEGIFLDHLEAE